MTESVAKETKPASLPVRLAAGLFRFITKFALIIAFVMFGLFAGGFLKFASTVTDYKVPQEIAKADAVVVLTGGASRIAGALGLMEDAKGTRLLISGVNSSTSTDDLLKLNRSKQALFDCCVDVERVARDTMGNAQESKKWMEVRQFESLILVTSSYHMPRSLLEFHRAMPTMKISAYAVPVELLSAKRWWMKSEALRLVMSEYIKYIGASLRKYLGSSTFAALHARVQGV